MRLKRLFSFLPWRRPEPEPVSLTHPGWLYLIRMATLESDRRVAWFRQETRAVWSARLSSPKSACSQGDSTPSRRA